MYPVIVYHGSYYCKTKFNKAIINLSVIEDFEELVKECVIMDYIIDIRRLRLFVLPSSSDLS